MGQWLLLLYLRLAKGVKKCGIFRCVELNSWQRDFNHAQSRWIWVDQNLDLIAPTILWTPWDSNLQCFVSLFVNFIICTLISFQSFQIWNSRKVLSTSCPENRCDVYLFLVEKQNSWLCCWHSHFLFCWLQFANCTVVCTFEVGKMISCHHTRALIYGRVLV